MKPHHIIMAVLAGAAAWLWRRNQRRINAVSLKNKVVVITGASAGIGKSTAHAFAKAGAHVVLVARRETVLNDVQAELAPYGVKTRVVAADITQPDDVLRLVAETLRIFGRADVLINNAGIANMGRLDKLSLQDVEQTIAINIKGSMIVTRAFLPLMRQQHSGHIVNIASVSGTVGAPGQTVYGTSKAALIAFSESLRREVHDDGVYVSNVMPGWTRTEMIDHISNDDLKQANMLPIFFPIVPSENVANAIVDAVRYRRRDVLMGGPGFWSMVQMQRFAPALMDMVYRFTDTEKSIEALSSLEKH